MRVQGFTYLGLLLFSLAGLTTLDWHRRLALFHDARRTLLAVALGVAVFLVWDAAGIALGVFARGDVPVMTGIELWPEMPVEEPVFLVLLTYLALLLWRLAETRGGNPRVLRVTRAGDAAEQARAGSTAAS